MYLYKWFTSLDHANLFIKDGEMLFRSGKFFRNFEDQKIGDKKELSIPLSKQSSVISGGSGENIFEIKEIKYETGNIGQCGFLYSLSRSSEPISDNYKYCVRVNSSEFISIVKQKVGHFFFEKELKTGNSIKITVPNFNFYTGPVQYKKDYLITANSRAIIINIPTSETSKPYFIKDDFYEEQKEFRFVTEFDFWEKSKRRMVHSDKYCLVSRLGNLGNIAVLLHSSST